MMILQPLTYQKFIIGILAIVLLVFSIKLYQIYKSDNANTDAYSNVYGNAYDRYNSIENFESVLNKLKSTNKGKHSDKFENIPKSDKKKNNQNNKKTRLKKKLTFDDLVKETEDIDPSKYSVSNIKNSFFTYVNSFKKDKFKNITGTTTEALEKFDYFKEKFFEIFN